MRILFLSCFFLLVIAVQVFAQSDDYLWPTDASRHLSSTFAETRSAHFHSGLDIKTWGREGYRVFASKDGYVSRMAISSQGYGRVLYLTHADGSVTVYAHLQRFIPSMQSYIDSLRLDSHSFEIDIVLKNKKWFFNQGDVIGFTGSTGVGPPHLHFEIRNGPDVALNALQSNLEITDTIAPVITSMLVIPMSDSTTIKGSKYPQLYYPAKNSDGSLSFPQIRANGPIGIAITEYDRANEVNNKYASYEFVLKNKIDTLFYSIHNSFHFDDAPTMPLDRIPAYSATRRSYQTLFSHSQFDVPFHQKKYGTGILNPDSISTEYHIELSDIYRNKTKASVSVLQEESAREFGLKEAPPTSLWYWQNDWVVQHSGSSINLTSNNFGANWDHKKKQRLLFYDGNTMLFSRVNPDSNHTIWSTDRAAKIHFPKQSTFDELSIALVSTSFQGFPSIQIQPNSAVLRNPIFIEYYVNGLDSLGSNPQLFKYDRLKDRFSHVPSTLLGKTIHTQTDALGEFVVFSDESAPEIRGIDIVQKDWGAWQIEISVFDELSGINFKKSEIRVNGVRGITEYDFEEDLLIYIHPDFEPKELNRIEVIVSDNAGNSNFQTFRR